MVMASDYADMVEDSHGFGWSTAPGTHSWPTLIAAKDREITRLNGIYVSMLEKAGITLFTGHAEFVDGHTLRITPSPLAPTEQPRTITAERIVIATGSTPTKLDIPGAELAITSDEAFALPQRPERVIMIGSGYIGIEFAGIFAGLGSQVDLVYRRDLPLRGFDEDMRTALADAIDARGITQHRHANPTSITRNGAELVLTLDNGQTLRADCIFMATGRRPKIDALGLGKTSITTADNGRIQVDGNSETAHPCIYAIGDVTDRINLTPVAIAEGIIWPIACLGRPPRASGATRPLPRQSFSPPLSPRLV